MNKDKYIKKLERRIHNQRVALRENWMIIEQRMKYRATPLRSMWFDKVKKLSKEVQELRKRYDESQCACMKWEDGLIDSSKCPIHGKTRKKELNYEI